MVFVRGEGSQCWFRHVRSHWTAFVKPLAPSSIEYFDIGMPVVVEDPPDAAAELPPDPSYAITMVSSPTPMLSMSLATCFGGATSGWPVGSLGKSGFLM